MGRRVTVGRAWVLAVLVVPAWCGGGGVPMDAANAGTGAVQCDGG